MDNKILKAMGMAAVFGITMQFVQPTNLVSQNASVIGMQSAEAGIFDGAIGALQGKAKKAAKDAVNHALDINYDGLNSHRNDMIHHLALAAGAYATSEYRIYDAVGQADNSNAQNFIMLGNSLTSGSRDWGEICETTSVTPVDKIALKNALNNMMNSQDKNAMEHAKNQMTWSKQDNAKAAFLCGLALRDAAFLTNETAKGLKQAKNLEDVKSQLREYTDAVEQVKQITAFINKNIKARNDARREYDKKNNIKEPAKKDIEAQVKQMAAE